MTALELDIDHRADDLDDLADLLRDRCLSCCCHVLLTLPLSASRFPLPASRFPLPASK